jgi:hypothetical protein
MASSKKTQTDLRAGIVRQKASGEIRPLEEISLENEIKSAPTASEIDTLLQLYIDADKNVESAIEKRKVFEEQIESLIEEHGFLPPRSKKSMRIQGLDWKASLSRSHSVEVDTPSVLNLHTRLKEWGMARVFRKLFRREIVFVLNDGAQELIATLAAKMPGIAANLQLAFSGTLRIESRSTTLKVESLKEKTKK